MKHLILMLVVALAAGCIEADNTKRDYGSGPARKPVAQPTYVPNISPTHNLPSNTQNTQYFPSYTPTQPQCYGPVDANICAAELRIFELTNHLRRQRNLPALQLSSKISFVSRDWSMQQANGGLFGGGQIGHLGFPSARTALYQQTFSSRPRLLAENVAYTYSSSPQAAAERLYVLWEGSSGHLENMLGSYQSIGIGIFVRDGNRYYATQIFGRDG